MLKFNRKVCFIVQMYSKCANLILLDNIEKKPWRALLCMPVNTIYLARSFLKFTNKEPNSRNRVLNQQWTDSSETKERAEWTEVNQTANISHVQNVWCACHRNGTISLKLPLFHVCDVCSSSDVLKCVFLDCPISSRLSNTRIFINNPYV